MTKAELVAALAKDSDVTKAIAAKVLDSYIKTVTEELQVNGKMSLVGFGTFSVVDREARMGRNPRTGEEIKIEARKVVKFKAGKALADQIQ